MDFNLGGAAEGRPSPCVRFLICVFSIFVNFHVFLKMSQIGLGGHQNVKLDVLDPILDPRTSKNLFSVEKHQFFSFRFPKFFVSRKWFSFRSSFSLIYLHSSSMRLSTYLFSRSLAAWIQGSSASNSPSKRFFIQYAGTVMSGMFLMSGWLRKLAPIPVRC